MFSVLVIRLRSLRLLRVSGIVMRLRMFLLLITFLKASHSFRNRLLVICKNAYLFATMIMTSVSSPFSCCSGIVRLILIFAAEGLTKRSAVGFLLRSLIMFQTFISRHNSNFFSDKLVLTSVTPASSAPFLQTPKSTPLIRLFLLVLILLLMPTLNFLAVWFALSLLRFRLPSRLPMMFILWMVAMMVVIIPSRTVCLFTSFPVRRAIMFMLVSWFGLTLPLLNAE